MTGRSCSMCVYRRSGFLHIGEGLEFICARRGHVSCLQEPCEDWCLNLSEDESITGGRGLVYVPSATAAVALRDGRTVAVGDVWYKVIDGRLCSLSPRGDNPLPVTDDPAVEDIMGQICYVLDDEVGE